MSTTSRTRTFLSNALIGIPGGCLILMAMLMFDALIGQVHTGGVWMRLALLCLTALIVGLLARLVRPINGFGAAVASGVVAAGLILFLYLTGTGAGTADLAIGPAGMLAALLFSSLGGRLIPRLRKGKQ